MNSDKIRLPIPLEVFADLPGFAGAVSVMSIVLAANLGLRLCVELATCGALGFWGASTSGSTFARTSLAIATPLAAIFVWSRFLSPKSRRHLGALASLFMELSIFATAAIALASSHQVFLASVFIVAATVSSLLFRITHQKPRVRGGHDDG